MTSPSPTADEHATAAPGGAVGRHRPRLAVDVDAANSSPPPQFHHRDNHRVVGGKTHGGCAVTPTCAAPG